ncbi:MAG: TetR/AcrR family transcriptional regulator [Chloroflexi bacterium]|nr:MAG: TetR/AcrR family transcriptional regulator [Chloroflexota bacterium]MBL1195736.1 TetR/AcrR family transcriptional regulator [Chloroflexota bacterium]NOH13025.1 TetR family transcriptional regulator [Chloroflexota bacterium]
MAKTRKLTRQVVVETAARLVDQAGSFEAISLAQLAAALDIRVPSLYNHVDGLKGLKYALTIYWANEFHRYVNETIQGKSGREALIAFAKTYRQSAKDHPGLYPLMLRAPEEHEEELAAIHTQFLNTVMLMLGSFGINGDQALHAIRGFRSLLHGFVSLDQVGGFGMPLDLDHSYELLTNMMIDGLEQLARN